LGGKGNAGEEVTGGGRFKRDGAEGDREGSLEPCKGGIPSPSWYQKPKGGHELSSNKKEISFSARATMQGPNLSHKIQELKKMVWGAAVGS